MRTRFLVIILLAAILSACGDAADFKKKIINSDNGEPLILFASANYELVDSFKYIGGKLIDGDEFCSDPAAATFTDPTISPIFINFQDCLDEKGITYTGTVTMAIPAEELPVSDWENLSYSLDFTGLLASSDWFAGEVMVSGALDYTIAGKAGSVELPAGTFMTEGETSKLELDALSITTELDEENPDVTETSVDSSGEQSSESLDSLPVTLKTSSILKEDTASETELLCPQSGALRLTTTRDGSNASLEYPSGTDNVYQIRTNGSFIERFDCL
ncbi:MAG: hypothetical protein PVH71_09300 [Chromatiales bacterium]|jgi:hypothetical protein